MARRPKIKRVGIVVKPDSAATAARARRLALWLDKRGIEVLAEARWAASSGRAGTGVLDRARMMRRADLVVSLGGDGTLLSVARLSRRGSAAVVGINHGGFGFLTVSDSGGLYATMRRILAGDFSLERRTMLRAILRRRGRVVARSQALNDAVVTRATFSRMLALEAEVDGTRLTEYLGDGLIVATPTGSTAYSLSAGGPVVDPAVGAIVVTPISPHTLNSRPLVLPERARVRIRVAASEEAVLTLDGQEAIELRGGDIVELGRSADRAAVVSSARAGYFEILRDKMGWGGKRRP